MQKYISIFLISFMTIAILTGCGGSAMHQTRIKTRGGLPAQVPQIDENARGNEAITLTEEMKYPGMTQYEDATYEFISGDPPEKVARWFIENLEDSTMNKTGSRQDDMKYVISWAPYVIDVVSGPNRTDTLIRYKRVTTEKKTKK